MSAADEVARLFAAAGGDAYFGEAISQLEHGLQAAALAEAAGASDTLVVAALLHDIGHLLHSAGEDVAERGIDARHEEIGARWLARRFPPELVEPVRLHVVAKRYLCSVERDYRRNLSPASQRSLELQGGALSSDAQAAFTASPSAQAALALRRWDDAAKIVGLAVAPLSSYRQRIARLAS